MKESEEYVKNNPGKTPVLFDQPILGAKGKLSFWEYDMEEAPL